MKRNASGASLLVSGRAGEGEGGGGAMALSSLAALIVCVSVFH